MIKTQWTRCNPLGISDPVGIGASDTLGAKLACQWVNLYVDDKHAFRAGKAKINTFAFCTDFQQIQKPYPKVKRALCHRLAGQTKKMQLFC